MNLILSQLLCGRGTIWCCDWITCERRWKYPIEWVNMLLTWNWNRGWDVNNNPFISLIPLFAINIFYSAEILIVILNNYESSALQNFLMHQPGQTLLSLLVCISFFYNRIPDTICWAYFPSLPYLIAMHCFVIQVSGMLTPGQGGVPLQLLEVTRMLLDCDATDRVYYIACCFIR